MAAAHLLKYRIVATVRHGIGITEQALLLKPLDRLPEAGKVFRLFHRFIRRIEIQNINPFQSRLLQKRNDVRTQGFVSGCHSGKTRVCNGVFSVLQTGQKGGIRRVKVVYSMACGSLNQR